MEAPARRKVLSCRESLVQTIVTELDGKEVWRSAAGGVSQVPEYIKLTEEIGKWGGEIRDAQLPDEFVVDNVRVYDLVEKPVTNAR
jgi:hypothetical protein